MAAGCWLAGAGGGISRSAACRWVALTMVGVALPQGDSAWTTRASSTDPDSGGHGRPRTPLAQQPSKLARRQKSSHSRDPTGFPPRMDLASAALFDGVCAAGCCLGIGRLMPAFISGDGVTPANFSARFDGIYCLSALKGLASGLGSVVGRPIAWKHWPRCFMAAGAYGMTGSPSRAVLEDSPAHGSEARLVDVHDLVFPLPDPESRCSKLQLAEFTRRTAFCWEVPSGGGNPTLASLLT